MLEHRLEFRCAEVPVAQEHYLNAPCSNFHAAIYSNFPVKHTITLFDFYPDLQYSNHSTNFTTMLMQAESFDKEIDLQLIPRLAVYMKSICLEDLFVRNVSVD